ncbi:MAG TPA: membrane dipeptidase [Candidatus Paceibacterota bacterium]|nr:membrane dipeptidase [Candidatus Paceibacterota bacterium]
MAFLAPPGQPPLFERGERPAGISLAHLTTVPPIASMENFEAAYTEHCTFRALALSNPDVHEVLTQNDVNRPGSTGLLFGMQQVPKNMSFKKVHALSEVGIRVMTLAYKTANEYGGGFASESGLTEYGKDLIEWIAECGMLLDLSHANHKTADDALEFIREEQLLMRPMASHSGCASVYAHPRNLRNDVIRGITKEGGYIGIPLINFFLGAEPGIPLLNFFRHVEYAVNIAGSKAVGIGSDCPHTDMTLRQAENQFTYMTRMLESQGLFGEYFPDRPEKIIRNGTQLFNILQRRLSKDYSTAIVENLCKKSFSSYLERALPR